MIRTSPVRAFATLSVASLAFAILALPSANTLSAHGVKKYREGRVVGHVRGKRKATRDRRHSYRRRDPAVFANQVDLSRPGGPERFFELLSEENR